jgi:hypothetical protein
MNNEEPLQENLDFSRPDFVFKPNEQHDWRQQGPYLVCKSCEISHATYIGPGKIMTGVNEKGQPIISKSKVFFRS